MKKIFLLLSLFAAVLCTLPRTDFAPLSVGTAAVDVGAEVSHANAIVYCGGGRLAVADDRSVKMVDTVTGKSTVIAAYGDGVGQIGLADALAFTVSPADFEVLYIRERAGGQVYRYDIATKQLTKSNAAPNFNPAPAVITDLLGEDFTVPSEVMGAYTVDWSNGVIYYIDAANTVKQIQTDLWTFKGKTNSESEWFEDITPLPENSGLYYRTNTGAVLYRYPNAVDPLGTVAAGVAVVVLDKSPAFGDKPAFDGWYYVLYGQGAARRTGYIESAALTPLTNYTNSNLSAVDKSIIDFTTFPEYVGRVIRNNTPVYKYPTNSAGNPVLGSLPKTKQAGNEVTDSVELKSFVGIYGYFFEIEFDGGVGFVPVNYIIDINKGGTSDTERIVTNASITVAVGQPVPVYKDQSGQNPADTDPLENGMRIRAVNYDKSSTWTKIYYVDPDIGEWYPLTGWIRTEYIAVDSWTPSQWLGFFIIIAMAAAGIAVVVVIIVRQYKKPLPQNAK